ncbi:hypothetical protein A0H81_12520 [Grifola frondosa]|uniref:Uncharacterized protein n=1 Tax=Grifola frondosa TaxID=5627 RepID=A0A1C7LRA8_GRIFR|nr:hypothetical protein A0H81_12520 [Grifola frondosa]
MVLRLCTPLEQPIKSLVPPPREQVPQSRPWRGLVLLSGASPRQGVRQEIHVTAAETDGDNSQVQFWPAHLNVQVVNREGILQQVHDWLRQLQYPLPRCMFMPDRLADQAATQANHANFELLSRRLIENQIIAIASWGVPDRLSGAGVLLYPASSSGALLSESSSCGHHTGADCFPGDRGARHHG